MQSVDEQQQQPGRSGQTGQRSARGVRNERGSACEKPGVLLRRLLAGLLARWRLRFACERAGSAVTSLRSALSNPAGGWHGERRRKRGSCRTNLGRAWCCRVRCKRACKAELVGRRVWCAGVVCEVVSAKASCARKSRGRCRRRADRATDATRREEGGGEVGREREVW